MKEKLLENEMMEIRNQIFDNLIEIDKDIFKIFSSISFYNFNQIRIKILKEYFDIKILENRKIKIYQQDEKEIFIIDYDFIEMKRIPSIIYYIILENYYNQKLIYKILK